MKDDQLKKLIKGIGLDEPGASFTDDTMKMIEAQEQLSLHPSLLPFIKSELVTEPGADFTGKVMAGIQTAKAQAATSIITKKFIVRFSVAALLVLLLALVIPLFTPGQANGNSYLPRININVKGPTMELISVAGTIFPYLIPFSFLLLVDYFFRARRTNKTSVA